MGRKFAIAAVVMAALAGAMAAEAQGPGLQCPQPRFTGKAPPEYYDRQSPLAADADTRRAERAFRGNGDNVSCASCHGEKGDGRGPMSGMFDPPPRNFRCKETVNGIPDGQLFWIIRFGSPGASMPPHPRFSDAEVWELVAYLRKLAR
jgi:mono/diheme cytochrome c family protein